MGTTLSKELRNLDVPEKIQVVQDLWDSIATAEEELPVPEWQKVELAKRKENFLKNPDSVLSWQQVKKSLLKR